MAISSSEYKKKKRVLFTLPSGAVFELRPMARSLYFKLQPDLVVLDELGKQPDTTTITEAQTKAISKVYDEILTFCVTLPKVVVTASNPDELEINDIVSEDQTAIVNKAFDMTGLSAEKVEERKNL